ERGSGRRLAGVAIEKRRAAGVGLVQQPEVDAGHIVTLQRRPYDIGESEHAERKAGDIAAALIDAIVPSGRPIDRGKCQESPRVLASLHQVDALAHRDACAVARGAHGGSASRMRSKFEPESRLVSWSGKVL